ncbi:glycerophosphodiester phosphodiesterase [Oceanospirillum beijerinckii]|uniref:glycerophosphodiester phosphodiesterase n=1 Tax=Oceanospirillum beijerinckii TaxID=64976 RepID=UPI00040BAE6B|nr:glycerophosphodiester phosphodiesterase family protein [Oceanospirillum beijerinckii]MAC45911.1 glycerophosphodiester phosphodiesterase [Oceanospirillum sp.]
MRFFAHRGAKFDGPENTLFAIEQAIMAGAEWVEIDIVAHQGRLLVIHDLTLERTTNGAGYIADYPLSYLRSLDAGLGQQVPYLEEVLMLTQGRVKLNIELKSPGSAGLLAVLLQKNEISFTRSDLLISSFDHRELLHFQQCCPDIELGLLICGTLLDLKATLGPLKVSSVHLSDEFVDPRFVAEIKAQGLAVYVYTVNSLSMLDRLQTLGIDGVFTDRSELWQQYRARMQ